MRCWLNRGTGLVGPPEVPQGAPLRVRVRKTPSEQEMDGVQLDRFTVGRVCDVSASLGSWLLAQGYANLEMRSSTLTTDEADFAMLRERGPSSVGSVRSHAADRRRRDR